MKRFFNWLFVVILILLTLGELQRITVTTTISFHLHDVLIGGWIASSLVMFGKQWQMVWRSLISKKWLLQKILVGWIALGLVIAAATHSLNLETGLYLARLILYALFAVSLTFTISWTRQQQRLLWTLTGLGIAWLGIVQYLLLPDTRFLKFLGWDDHYYRMISTLFDPNFTGIILVLTTYYLWSVRAIARNLNVVLTAVLLVCVVLTFSRATYVTGLLSGLVLLLLKLKVKRKALLLAATILVGGLIIFWVLPKPTGEGVDLLRTYSIQQRVLSSQRALTSMQPYQWLTGRGLLVPFPGTPNGLPQHAPFPDNLFALLLAELGVPGFLLALVVTYQWSVHLYHRDAYLFAGWLAVLLHSQFNHTLFQPFVLLFLLGGMSSLELKGHR